VRKVDAATGVITPIAGDGQCGFGGDGGAGIFSQLNSPSGLAVDVAGFLYIADLNNQRIRRLLTGPGGIINTIAGTGEAAYAVNGGPALSAKIWGARKVAVAPNGDLVFSDNQNQIVRKIAFNVAGGGCSFASAPPPRSGESGLPPALHAAMGRHRCKLGSPSPDLA
jgi:DNA-binding beta-propeller fold protein YncE